MLSPRKNRYVHRAARRALPAGGQGFTLFEILIGLALGMMVSGMIIAATVNFSRNRQLDAAAEIAVSYLRTAAARAMQSEGNQSHGVSFVGANMTLFRGAAYASRESAYDVTWMKPSYLTVTGISEVVFSKQAGVPSATGDIVLSNGSRSATVRVYSTGAISQQ